MKKAIIFFAALICGYAQAQETIPPAKAQSGRIVIRGGTVHTGTGAVLENTDVVLNNGRIESVGGTGNTSGATVVDAAGKHVYPGLILANTIMGLREIANAVRGSNDYNELGDLNPNINTLVGYNTESKIIYTLRGQGILMGNIVPRGSLLAGMSNVVQYDAWNYEDAVYKANTGINFYMPSLINRPNRTGETQGDVQKQNMDRIESVRIFFREAKVYNSGAKPRATNLKLESAKGLFTREQKLFIHCNVVKEMLLAIDIAKEFNFDAVIVGGSESWQIAPLLQQNNIAVILKEMHDLPTLQDDDIDQNFKTPAVLQKAGVLFAITDEHGESTGRNLSYNAGTAAAYGLTKEQALAAITLNAAKILGMDSKTGSIEAGKDANIIITKGDVLDMRSSEVVKAFIQGRDVTLDDKQKQLARKYAGKYGQEF